MLLRTRYKIDIMISTWFFTGIFASIGIFISVCQSGFYITSILFSFITVVFGIGSLIGFVCIGVSTDKDFIEWCNKSFKDR